MGPGEGWGAGLGGGVLRGRGALGGGRQVFTVALLTVFFSGIEIKRFSCGPPPSEGPPSPGTKGAQYGAGRGGLGEGSRPVGIKGSSGPAFRWSRF